MLPSANKKPAAGLWGADKRRSSEAVNNEMVIISEQANALSIGLSRGPSSSDSPCSSHRCACIVCEVKLAEELGLELLGTRQSSS